MVVGARIFLVFPFIAMTFFLYPKYDRYEESIFVLDELESHNSIINYVSIDGIRYLLKQKKAVSKQFCVVRDALAAYIAKDLAIAHTVKIIPANKQFPKKMNPKWPATLHSIAPGKTVRSQPESKYYNLSLKQREPGEINQWFTETIVYQMTWHWQLPIIIGLDLFICNTDRHRANLFYDPKTDLFCAIDMDNIFRRDLPGLAREKLKLMIERNKKFTDAEIKALMSMRDTLQFLLDRYSSTHLIDKLLFFCKQAGFAQDDPFYTEKVAKKIARHKRIIIQSRTSAYALITLINKIVNDYSR